MFATVDPGSKVRESNERNNVRTLTVGKQTDYTVDPSNDLPEQNEQNNKLVQTFRG